MSKCFNQLIANIAETVKPLVQHIEATVPMTQDHYDQYWSAIESVAAGVQGHDPRTVKLTVAYAFTEAGANRNGVMAALKLMGVL